MARLVRLEATGPIRVEPSDKPIFVCACGLSRKFPFCDGTHKACRDEPAGSTCRYDPATGERIETNPA